ncbi:MAG: hypothetical protein AAGN46_09720 [Acidobacteriota bacterium]
MEPRVFGAQTPRQARQVGRFLQLHRRQRAALALVKLEGLGFERAAFALNMSEARLERLLLSALDRLADGLEPS